MKEATTPLKTPQTSKEPTQWIGDGGVTPLKHLLNDIEGVTSIMSKRIALSQKFLLGYMPNVVGVRLPYCFGVLEYLNNVSCSNEYSIRCNLSSGNEPVKRAIKYLVEHSYVYLVRRFRKIMIFGVYVPDKAYKITVKGKKLLREVYEGIGIL